MNFQADKVVILNLIKIKENTALFGYPTLMGETFFLQIIYYIYSQFSNLYYSVVGKNKSQIY